MYFGKLVELGATEQVFTRPRHPYTRALLGTLDEAMEGEADPEAFAAPPSAAGCRYASRCPHRIERCGETHPPLKDVAPGHEAACIRLGEPELEGRAR
jgi:oligopeptide/dipeptide ABC transporter ATP-binding protein